MAHELEYKALARYLDEHKLKHTKQREAILEAFLEARGHVTSEDLYNVIKARHAGIGFTTVSRTRKLLCESGLANERHFDDGVTPDEIQHDHHAHLVCVRCGRIVEFECTMIESAQDEIAARYGFRLLRHRHELYGHCSDCAKKAE
jgi:Fur family ferric uptake transcriptional regulator